MAKLLRLLRCRFEPKRTVMNGSIRATYSRSFRILAACVARMDCAVLTLFETERFVLANLGADPPWSDGSANFKRRPLPLGQCAGLGR
jgi:hypothetical protein